MTDAAQDMTTAARRGSLGWLSALAVFAAFACATASPGPIAHLKIESTAPEASVFLDDVYAGRAAEWGASAGKAVRPGFHRIELRLAEHHSYFTEVTVAAGTTFVVRAVLQRQLD